MRRVATPSWLLQPFGPEADEGPLVITAYKSFEEYRQQSQWYVPSPVAE